MSVTISRTSRLLFSELKSIDGVEFWDLLDLPAYIANADDITHTVQESDRIDKLAYRYYQEPALWWVIAWANDIEVLPTALVRGRQIIIPSPTFVRSRLFSGLRRGR